MKGDTFSSQCCKSVNSLPNNKKLDLSKLKAFADDILKIIKMMISLLDRVENNVGKGENVGHQHFLLFPQCFLKSSSSTLFQTSPVFMCLQYKSFENTVGKGEIAHNKQFLLF